jgi:penicillin-binding protein 1C
MLPARGGVHAPRPASVRAVEICWPLGEPATATQSMLCRQRRTAWSLDGALPPTFAERDPGAWMSGRVELRVDARGRRLSAGCHTAYERRITLARWPALATPWLGAADRNASSLPALAPGCAPDSLAQAVPIRIAGLREGSTLRQAPNSGEPLRVAVHAPGALGDVQWLLDGRLQGRTHAEGTLTLTLARPGRHALTALSQDGAWASVGFGVAAPAGQVWPVAAPRPGRPAAAGPADGVSRR